MAGTLSAVASRRVTAAWPPRGRRVAAAWPPHNRRVAAAAGKLSAVPRVSLDRLLLSASRWEVAEDGAPTGVPTLDFLKMDADGPEG